MKTKVDVNLLKNFISEKEFSEYEPLAVQAWATLCEKTGPGSEFTGWLNLPSSTLAGNDILSKIHQACNSLTDSKPDVIVVIGIGGSYLGTRAVCDALTNPFDSRTLLPIVYAGHQLDADYHARLIAWLRDKNPVVVVVSKSGTTTEPAIAFRLLREFMEYKYGHRASDRIFAITDKSKGALRALAEKQGYKTFVIPDNIGGRFSVFTPVGLLPLALSGVNVPLLLEGAAAAEKELTQNKTFKTNPALQYAAARQILSGKGKKVELLSTFYPRLSTLSEWWKQLFGESEGKDQKGIFPASLVFSTDLHSLGQFVQDGLRFFFETFIHVDSQKKEVTIPKLKNDDDGLMYLEGKAMSLVNNKAEQATRLAHEEGGVPVIGITLPAISEYTIGELLYFFEFSCGISAYLSGVNPFDQPGVEAYKRKMFELLGKK